MWNVWSGCCLEGRLTRRLKRWLSSNVTVSLPSCPLTVSPHLSLSLSLVHTPPLLTPTSHLKLSCPLLPWPHIARACGACAYTKWVLDTVDIQCWAKTRGTCDVAFKGFVYERKCKTNHSRVTIDNTCFLTRPSSLLKLCIIFMVMHTVAKVGTIMQAKWFSF